MDEHLEDVEATDTAEKPDPPRSVRGLRWVFIPGLLGAAVGAAWSAYYSAFQHIDPATPIWVGGVVGLGIGALLWVAFPYKGRPHRRSNPPKGGAS
jgi:hypothetical protein